MIRKPLPIDDLLPGLLDAIRSDQTVIVKAAPGAGKTTRIPPALLDAVAGTILVLEPRRLAARMSAERVAEEMDESCGTTVGFHIRFEQKASAATRIKFITEGMFLRYLQADPTLRSVGCIILDEFHERHIHSDVALALTRHLQATERPDLKLVIMSATLDLPLLEEALPGARVFESEGRAFPVEVRYMPPLANENRERVTCVAARDLIRNTSDTGHILVFLPGAAEIRRVAEMLAAETDPGAVEILELRAEIPFAEQRRVFVENGRRKIILSTNVAETSLTIPGVTAVVDTGVAKVPGYAGWSGLPTLDLRSVSRSSCVQRAGRAGRTAPGVAVRLYQKSDFETRPQQEKPEIERSDLAQIVLDLLVATNALGLDNVSQISTLPWLTPPPAAMVAAAEKTLCMLGALDDSGRLSPTGRRLAEWPIHPRLARVVFESAKLGIGRQGALAAALLAEGMLLRRGTEADTFADSDLFLQMELALQARRKSYQERRTRDQIDPAKLRRIQDLASALSTGFPQNHSRSDDAPLDEPALTRALLCAFPDRVAQVRRRHQTQTFSRIELNLCQGGGAILAPASVVQKQDLLIALEADDSPTQGNASTSTVIRVASAISADRLLDDPAGLIRESNAYTWDDKAERIRGTSRILYGNLVIDESPLDCRTPEAEELLRRTLLTTWPKPFDDNEPIAFFQARATLLRPRKPDLNLPDFLDESLADFCAFIARGKVSYREVLAEDLEQYIAAYVDPVAYAQLEREFPRSLRIGGGRQTKVHYVEGQPPWIASRLQDFLGTTETPLLASGTLGVVVHLLAPNGQALQVTQDLRGFWDRDYPVLRKEYMRRYPRHFWPEDPLRASPPPAGKLRPNLPQVK
jgi:ATP-dependent helicase HrpB